MSDPLLDDLLDWLRIPSISTGGGLAADVKRAAEWALERVDSAGGSTQLVSHEGLNPIAYGELAASGGADAPTVLVYGHYDVQSVGDASAWRTDPFEPEVRDGRIWARGASDDKGNFWPLLHVATELARNGELPVNVRVVVEGEEEAGGEHVARWLAADERGADAAIVFDSGMAATPEGLAPAITVGLRGVVMLGVEVRTGRRDVHSGMYGGSVLNAGHALHQVLAAVLPGPDGTVREELRVGVAPPAAAERESWARLTHGDELLAEVGARPLGPDAGARFYERNGADTALDVNEVVLGQPRTIVPATARATLSVRLAPGQSSAEVLPVLKGLLSGAAPEGAEVTFDGGHSAEPARFDVSDPALQLAAGALERACGVPTAFVRTGGSIPIVADLAAKGIPTVVSGFALADDDIHAPNESYRVESLRLGARAAHELYHAFARLGA